MKRNELLREIYSNESEKNAKYSLRQFSKDIGINVATCSRVLSNTEELSFFQIRKLLQHPKIDPTTKGRLRATLFDETEESVPAQSGLEHSKFTDLDIPFDFEWTDIALMELLQIPGIDCTIDSLAKMLELRTADIVPAIERLEKRGLIAQRGERYIKTHKKLILGGDANSKHRIREFHRNFALKGLQSLTRFTEADIDRRLINSYVIATNSKKIAAAKELQIKFQKDLIELLTDCEPTCLYGLSTIFFPISEAKQ